MVLRFTQNALITTIITIITNTTHNNIKNQTISNSIDTILSKDIRRNTHLRVYWISSRNCVFLIKVCRTQFFSFSNNNINIVLSLTHKIVNFDVKKWTFYVINIISIFYYIQSILVNAFWYAPCGVVYFADILIFAFLTTNPAIPNVQIAIWYSRRNQFASIDGILIVKLRLNNTIRE